MNAELQSHPPLEWAALRTWAAAQRDRVGSSVEERAAMGNLVSVLDAQETLRVGSPALAAALWTTARSLATLLHTNSLERFMARGK